MAADLYIQLLYKRLSDELSPSEKEQLEAWLAASEENRQTAKSVELAWQASGNLQTEMEIDLDAEFAALEGRLETPTGTEKTPPPSDAKVIAMPASKSRRSWWSIAAGLALLATAAFLWSQYFQQPTIEWVEVRTQDTRKTIQLADKTQVLLAEQSYFKYPKTFAATERDVYLEGVAFFDVAHRPEQPFEVETSHEVVRVLGTSFQVQAQKDSVLMRVEVVSGKVEVRPKSGFKKVFLTKGQQGIVDRNAKTANRKKVHHHNDLAWATGQLAFDDMPLVEVLEDISLVHSVEFGPVSDPLKKCPFTATFSEASLKEILETIEVVLGVRISKNTSGVYTLEGGGC